MRETTGLLTSTSDKKIKDIGRATRNPLSVEDKVRVVLEGLRGRVAAIPPARQPVLLKAFQGLRSTAVIACNSSGTPPRQCTESQHFTDARTQQSLKTFLFRSMAAHKPTGAWIAPTSENFCTWSRNDTCTCSPTDNRDGVWSVRQAGSVRAQ